jgi:hypothetical protein
MKRERHAVATAILDAGDYKALAGPVVLQSVRSLGASRNG